MVKHIILWNLKDSLTPAQKDKVLTDAKVRLEALVGQIDGLISLTVHINPLPTSNADFMLDSSFENEAALAAYAVHPAHVAVADTYVRPFTSARRCLDFTL